MIITTINGSPSLGAIENPGPPPPRGSYAYQAWYLKYLAYKKALEERGITNVTRSEHTVTPEQHDITARAHQAANTAMLAAFAAGKTAQQSIMLATQAAVGEGMRESVAQSFALSLWQRGIIKQAADTFKAALAAGKTPAQAVAAAKAKLMAAGMSAAEADATLARAAAGPHITTSVPQPIKGKIQYQDSKTRAWYYAVPKETASTTTTTPTTPTTVSGIGALPIMQTTTATRVPAPTMPTAPTPTPSPTPSVPAGTPTVTVQTHVLIGSGAKPRSDFHTVTESAFKRAITATAYPASSFPQGPPAPAPSASTLTPYAKLAGLTDKWWFWVGLAAAGLVVGGGTYIIFRREP